MGGPAVRLTQEGRDPHTGGERAPLKLPGPGPSQVFLSWLGRGLTSHRPTLEAQEAPGHLQAHGPVARAPLFSTRESRGQSRDEWPWGHLHDCDWGGALGYAGTDYWAVLGKSRSRSPIPRIMSKDPGEPSTLVSPVLATRLSDPSVHRHRVRVVVLGGSIHSKADHEGWSLLLAATLQARGRRPWRRGCRRLGGQ